MELRRCSNGITNSRTHPAIGGDIAIVPTRSVHGRYLLDTEEYGEDGGWPMKARLRLPLSAKI